MSIPSYIPVARFSKTKLRAKVTPDSFTANVSLVCRCVKALSLKDLLSDD